MMTLQERFGSCDGKRFLLTWTYHPRPLNTAVANSALLIASKFGMDVTVLCPTEEYRLDDRYMSAAQQYAAAQGRTLQVVHDVDEAYAGADLVAGKRRSRSATLTSTSWLTSVKWGSRRGGCSATVCPFAAT
jgi:N-acetylornithine carbamoyltransferase